MKAGDFERQAIDSGAVALDDREAYHAPTLERLGSVTGLTASTAAGSGTDSYSS